MKKKVLKDYVGRNSGVLHKAGSTDVWTELGKYGKALIEHGFVEVIENKMIDFSVIATSKLANVEIADRDYTEGDKKYFTFDEALEVEKKLKSIGWRLPTRHEWALIAEEFACAENDKLEGEMLVNKLKLSLNGYADENGDQWSLGSHAFYWSSSNNSATLAFGLVFTGAELYPSGIYYRYYGFSLRLVRDLKTK